MICFQSSTLYHWTINTTFYCWGHPTITVSTMALLCFPMTDTYKQILMTYSTSIIAFSIGWVHVGFLSYSLWTFSYCSFIPTVVSLLDFIYSFIHEYIFILLDFFYNLSQGFKLFINLLNLQHFCNSWSYLCRIFAF